MKNINKFLQTALISGAMILGYFGIASAHHDEVEIDVWADHGFNDPYCANDEFDLYLRPARNCYVTIMVIDPHGYANIIYPINNHHQRRLRRGRVYRLSDLLDDPFYFYDFDGRVHISVVATRRPVFLNPWLLDEVRTYSYQPYRFNAFGVRVSFGNLGFDSRFSAHWSRHIRAYGYGVFTTSIVLNHNHRHKHQRFYKRRAYTRRDWEQRWAYRSHEPVIRYKDRRPDEIHVEKRQVEYRKSNSSRRVAKSRYEKNRPQQIIRKNEARKSDIQENSRKREISSIPRQKELTGNGAKVDGDNKERKASRRVKKKVAYRKK